MKPVGKVAQAGRKLPDLFLDAGEPMGAGAVPGRGELPHPGELPADQGEALNHVVVHLARHPGALLLLGLEEVLGIGAVHGRESALIDHQGCAEGGEDSRDGKDTGDEGPEEGCGRTGHQTPRAMSRYAAMSTTALTVKADNTTGWGSPISSRAIGSIATAPP